MVEKDRASVVKCLGRKMTGVAKCLGCKMSECQIGHKVELLEVLWSFGDIFSQKLRLLRRKKYVKMASIGNFCDRFPCEITESLKPFGSCHK